MKKRIFVMLMICALLLTACGSRPSEREDVGGRIEAPAATEAPAETQAEVQERPISLGRVEGGTYINEYAGFGCDLDESWEFFSAEELQEMPALVKEAAAGSELGDALDPLNQFTDVMAENVDMMASFNVLYQKMTMEERLGNMLLSEEQMVDGVLGMKDQMIAAYAQAGILVDTMEKVTVNFAGETRTAVRTISTIEGIPYITLQLFCHQLGSHNVTLTLSSYVEDNTMELLELFYSVK